MAPVAHTLSTDEAKALCDLCEAGRLFEVEDWIRAGKSIAVSAEFKRTPLGVAVRTGFHSLIELLLRHETSQDAKNKALRAAVEKRRLDLVELAVAHGAQASAVPFADALFTWDRRTGGVCPSSQQLSSRIVEHT